MHGDSHLQKSHYGFETLQFHLQHCVFQYHFILALLANRHNAGSALCFTPTDLKLESPISSSSNPCHFEWSECIYETEHLSVKYIRTCLCGEPASASFQL